MDKEKVNLNHISWGAAADGLRLGLGARDGMASLTLQNVGNLGLEVFSYVQAHEVHLDWYTLKLSDENRLTCQLRLFDARNRSTVIRVRLEPGESLQHSVDVAGWAKRLVNGAIPLAAGSYQLSAVYEVADEKDCWLGHLEAGPVRLTISQATTSPYSPAARQEDG
jgi:hypothetical protein